VTAVADDALLTAESTFHVMVYPREERWLWPKESIIPFWDLECVILYEKHIGS